MRCPGCAADLPARKTDCPHCGAAFRQGFPRALLLLPIAFVLLVFALLLAALWFAT